MVAPVQKINLLSENQILDTRQEIDKNKFKYQIIRIRNQQEEMEGYNIIINDENKRRIQTKRDRKYHGFHKVTLSQIRYLNNNRDPDGNKKKSKTGLIQQQHATEENDQRVRTDEGTGTETKENQVRKALTKEQRKRVIECY